jgi:GT2 family glycosyltransferase
MNKLAIVILNYNGRHYLQKFLPTLLKYASNYPVYVADNHSSDQSVSYLKEEFPSVQILTFEKNYGFSDGYNRALDLIGAEYFILLNSDVEVTPGWLDPLLRLMDLNPKIAACQPKLLQYDDRSRFEYAGAAGGFIDQFGYPFCRGRIFKTMERDFGQYNDTCPVFWASGACMMIRSSVFKDLGGFDPDYFAHMEEIDLCWRMKLSGFDIYYCGESVIYHVGGGTLHESDPFKTYLNFRNSLITLIKNSRRSKLFAKLFMRLVFDLIASLKFLLFDSPGDAGAVIRANYDVYRIFRHHSGKRKRIKRDNKTLTNVYHRSVVLSYYLRGKKYFFNLGLIIPDTVIPAAEPFPEIHREGQGQVKNYRGTESDE